jgi:hypothetical protein
MIKFHFVFLFLFPLIIKAQVIDSALKEIPANYFSVTRVMYKKPHPFSFLTNMPADIAGFTKQSFKKENFSNLYLIATATTFLYIADQSITNTVHDKFEDNNIVSSENFSPFIKVNIGGKPTNIGKVPKNINTAFYDLGQGSSAMFMAAGFYLMGKIKKDNRALQTASELTEAFLALGLGTQVIKYATGRENPSDATVTRGRWRPFPSWKNFQNNKTKYDAFPSGHLATFVSAVTIIGENYPEKKWIRPVGYSIAGLCGLAMINNGVHWASDFPLGFALGYGFGKFISKKNRIQLIL